MVDFNDAALSVYIVYKYFSFSLNDGLHFFRCNKKDCNFEKKDLENYEGYGNGQFGSGGFGGSGPSSWDDLAKFGMSGSVDMNTIFLMKLLQPELSELFQNFSSRKN